MEALSMLIMLYNESVPLSYTFMSTHTTTHYWNRYPVIVLFNMFSQKSVLHHNSHTKIRANPYVSEFFFFPSDIENLLNFSKKISKISWIYNRKPNFSIGKTRKLVQKIPLILHGFFWFSFIFHTYISISVCTTYIHTIIIKILRIGIYSYVVVVL
jgi:hypothetical protein